MESLGLNAGVDALVDNDTDGVLGHIEDAVGLTVVELVTKNAVGVIVNKRVNTR